MYKLFCMISVNIFDVVSGGNHRRRQLLIKGRTSFYSWWGNNCPRYCYWKIWL